ncbi:ESX secretion-associated protein EspG [Amycolatopsis nigrescens]|uniref:ESX secretion-associated protein EspG n=1 Tax=Amycolatopsis nigrescens TaxID=381445 RepID=UPI000377DE6E|nr:ESX secretion-associated protein EspG [Amycolatopsis nigrescens]
MTATIEREAAFELVELDLLATHAGVPFPFPLRVPSFGRLADERDALLASAGHALHARGLATEHGPAGIADDLVDALREYRSAVDLVVIGARAVTGAVAVVHGDWALVCRQSLSGEQAGTVGVTRAPAATLSDELAGLIPSTPPASTMPITLPPGVVGDTLRLLEKTADTPDTRQRVRDLVRSSGGDETVVDQLVDLFPVLVGRGQFGVVHRRGSTVSRPREVSWLDSPRGRFRVNEDGAGWVSVNPLRHSELRRVLGEVAAEARA